MSVEVPATPIEVLQRLLRERPLWQTGLEQEKVLETLDKQTDVYQYSCRNMAPQPSCDYVVLRSGFSVSLNMWLKKNTDIIQQQKAELQLLNA